MKKARILLIAVLIAAAFLAGYGYGRWYGPSLDHAEHAAGPPAAPARYHCPMHPTYVSDEPGDCPVCGMRLVPIEPDDPPAAAGHAPEHQPSGASPLPMGTIRVSPEKQQLIGVRYGTAEYTAGVRAIRAVGRVAFDETRIARVQTRIEGWIDEVFVDFIGKLVDQGQPLLTIYSPEMLASQEEYLLALRSRDILQSSPLARSLQQADSLVAAARRRLELWDLSEAQIEQVAQTSKPITNVTLYSPIRGHVISRNAFPKQRITPETELYTLADLSNVWIMAEIFEGDAPMVRLGMPATVTLAYAGGRRIRARVDYIQPQFEPATRTLKVRLEAANPQGLLKPDMFVDVDLEVALPRRLTVPAEAVLDSGLRQTVFVDRGNGYLEPREVAAGERLGDRVEIVRGLEAGERVVTSGAFLIDSESQLRSAAAGMAGHRHGAPAAEPAPSQPTGHEGHGSGPTPPAPGHKHD
jgi:membrane fusion protein, copper/silver efflux system